MSETNKTYRNAGFYKFGDGFTIQNNAPIDCRTYVSNITDIYDDANWAGIGVKPYPGMIVSAPSGDVKIYVGEVITDIAAITNSTEQIGWRNKENWLDVNIPKIESTDVGRLLTIVETTNDDQSKSYSAQWVDAPSGLPTMGKNEAGKLLTVVETSPESGVYVAQWVDAPSGLPTINPETDANKVLQVNADGTGVTWVENTHPEELPTYTDADSGKVLTVSSDGTSTEWSTVDTRFMKNVTTGDLLSIANHNDLKPGMKYRIIDYYPAINTNYTININNSVFNIGALSSSEVKFDIVVTASSENTLFDDAELVAKDGTAPFDYTTYEVKYDLIGNSKVLKYNYIIQGAGGVIYYMKDQFGNEASYDFENIVYVKSGRTSFTFDGGNAGDLRQTGVIRNVRIKTSIETLPGILFGFNNFYFNQSATLNDVEINNCVNIYTYCTNLRNTKISNSANVFILMPFDETIGINPMFENLNICGNYGLSISGDVQFLRQFNDIGGFYINNLNILPTRITKSIDISSVAEQMANIFRQGIIDTDITNKMKLMPDNGGWTLEAISPGSEVIGLLFGQQSFGNIINQPNDLIIYDVILNALKNVKPFDIFNATDDIGRVNPWSLEIPQFHTTATSVVELGI